MPTISFNYMLPEITHIIASLIANPPGGAATISVKEAVTLALATRPLRYGLTTEYSLRRYRALRRGRLTLATPEARLLWEELAAKIDRRLADHPSEGEFEAIEHILSNDSPSRYFLTPAYAEKLFYRRLSRKRRLPSRSARPCHPNRPGRPSLHASPSLPGSPSLPVSQPGSHLFPRGLHPLSRNTAPGGGSWSPSAASAKSLPLPSSPRFNRKSHSKL